MGGYGVDTAAALTGFPRGTLGVMVTREKIPGFPWSEPADFCSLVLAKKLNDRGLAVEPACSIAWAMRDEWSKVILADEGPDAPRQFVAVANNPPGDPVPYTWVLGAGEPLLDFIEAGDRYGVTLVVNATEIVRTVLLGLLDAKPSPFPVTSNGTLRIKAKRRVRARSRARL